MSPRILLIALEDWHSTARLPGALVRAGFEVGMLSEPRNLGSRSRHVMHRYFLDVPALHRGGAASILTAFETFQPDLVVPGDERAVRLLHFLIESGSLASHEPFRRTIERSVGRIVPGGHGGERLAMLDLAERLGIATARHAHAHELRDVMTFAAREGWPVYLKRDHTYGGQGVRFCPDATVATAAYEEFSFGHRLDTVRGLWRHARRLYETMRHGRTALALPIGTGAISVERAVEGVPAYYTGIALGGRVLAGFAAEVLAFEPPNGPSTRVRLHHDAEMDRWAAKLVEARGYAGFFGLDFIRRADGSLAFLEFNDRPTTVSHLGGLVGADLCTALFAVETGAALQSLGAQAEARVVLFPQDWIRDPRSNDRHQFLLDIPGDDPPLLEGLNNRLPPSVDKAEIDGLSRRASSGETWDRGAIE